MSTTGWFNHYDDPDEYWDEEPLAPTRQKPVVAGPAWSPPETPSLRPTSEFSQPFPSSPQPSASPLRVSMATMRLDVGLLPVGIELSKQWDRYVEPHQCAHELMLAYNRALNEHFARAFSSDRWPSKLTIAAYATPPRRTMWMLLLETRTWEEYHATCSRIVARGDFRVNGDALIHGYPAVAIQADRIRLRSIQVSPDWVARVEPRRIADEVLICTDRVRSLRPNLTVHGDYTRYSDEDLESMLNRHYQRLLDERMH